MRQNDRSVRLQMKGVCITIDSALQPLWTAVRKGCVFTQTKCDREGFPIRDIRIPRPTPEPSRP